MRKPFLLLLILFAFAGTGYYVWNLKQVPSPADPPPAWVKSTDLKATQILPSIDTPLTPGRSAIWCASFQLAWDKLCADVNGEPVILQDSEEVSHRLNQSKYDPNQLVKGSYYIAAGTIQSGIQDNVVNEMGNRFPNHKVPPLEVNANTNAIAYAYLEANLRFGVPYFADDLSFQDSNGIRSKVRAFGISKKHNVRGRSPREQLELLSATANEFAIDLDKHSSPHQIIVASIEPNGTFADRWKYLSSLIKSGKNRGAPIDEIVVPKMNWGVDHRFPEIEKVVKNGRLKDNLIVEALQSTRFAMNEHGVSLASEARIVAEEKSIARDYYFDRPFLIAILKRGATEPFFLMWVDNAELMME